LSKNQFTIRPFVSQDLSKVEEILKHIGWAAQYVEGQKKSITRLLNDEEGQVFVALKDEEILGFIQVQHLRWNRLSYLHGLVVSPNYRRWGVASQLVLRVEEASQLRGNRGVFVDTPVDNLEGRAFYKSQGYQEAYIMPSYYEAGLDGVTYQKFFEFKTAEK
jgi:ribosomal protein S18 acetylase RimI-like enzyme